MARTPRRPTTEYRTHVDAAIRELATIEHSALPAYTDTLHRIDLEADDLALEVMRAGQRVEHLLGVVEERLQQLWRSEWFGDRVIAMLLTQLAALRARTEHVDEHAASRTGPVRVAAGTPAEGVPQEVVTRVIRSGRNRRA